MKMENTKRYDVIVVGGGPGGAVASKRCADRGVKTLLIEKKGLPRDKVCTGMIMGKWAVRIIAEEFGEIPEWVLTSPPAILGHRLYVPGVSPRTFESHTILTWRKDLDHWLIKEAVASGVTFMEAVRVSHITSTGEYYRVDTVTGDGKRESLNAKFIIGADGATSVVRRSIFPEFNARYSGPVREYYKGALSLEKDYIHWFFPKGRPRPRFNVNHKDDVFLLEGAGVSELREEIAETLYPYGFDPLTKPVKKDGCAIALLHEPLLKGSFVPAKENVLLVGDAAGLILPITFEGIGTALKSGLLAADAVIEYIDKQRNAAFTYLKSINSIVEAIRHLYSDRFQSKGINDPGELADSLVSAYEETLIVQK